MERTGASTPGPRISSARFVMGTDPLEAQRVKARRRDELARHVVAPTYPTTPVSGTNGRS